MAEFARYVVYVDESGDPGLTGVDPEFPVFALAFCIFDQADYTHMVIPDLSALKFKYWGHDCAILHENKMRRREGDFEWLMADRLKRAGFFADLHDFVHKAPFRIIASVINKKDLSDRYSEPWDPYDLAVHFCLERLNSFLLARYQHQCIVHVIFECRGKYEDNALELVFRRIVSGEDQWGWRRANFDGITFEPKFVPKSANIPGLQLADLVARPIALRTFRPHQENRTYAVLKEKIWQQKTFP